MEDVACDTTTAAPPLVIAVCDGRRSRRAVRWAAKNLIPDAHRVLLLHVIPSVSSIPSPTGKHISIQHMEKDVVEMYIQDVKSQSQKVFSPFKKLCGTRNVETLVLDGENPASSLVKHVIELGIQNLVLGSSSFSWIRKIRRYQDVPSTVLKLAPDSCNIFVMSRRKLTIKFASQPIMNGGEINAQMKRISQKDFSKMEQNLIFHKQISVRSSQGSETLQSSKQSDLSSFSHASRDDIGSIDRNLESTLASRGNIPFIIMNSPKEGEALAEVARLRSELQNALATYNRTCGDLVHAKRKVQVLSAAYSDEAKKVNDSLRREEIFRQIAAEEKAKHLKAIEEIQEARELLSKEALDRHKAEITAGMLSSENSKAIDSFVSNDKRCRIYTRGDIESATDNFSDAKKIGEGSYGDVYKCILDHTPVAVKVLRQDAIDKKEEFLREVEVLSQLRHPHMVLLLGVCPENGSLVYEYMENGSLEDQLFYRDSGQPLPWYIRLRVIFEVACGLAFLHATKPEPIVHCDLKPGNILLNRNYVSKIGDVGLAKLLSDVVPDGLTEYRETVLAGTLYYMDPEYQRTGTIRPKSDLYALGIIVLQVLTGRHPKGLVMCVENAVRDGCFAGLLDGSVSDWPVLEAERLAKIALKCSGLRCRDRPDLEAEVLPELEELLSMANACFRMTERDVFAPSHYLCPILQETMENPYVAADGYTYEFRAIKAWLDKHKVSPVTKRSLRDTTIIPNHSLRSAIQEWKSHSSSPTL